MPTVYVIQNNPFNDTTSATQYGELKVLVPFGDNNYAVRDTITLLKDGLKDFKEGDYVLLMGDPVAIALTGLVLYEVLGETDHVRFLKWNRRTSEYILVEFAASEASY